MSTYIEPKDMEKLDADDNYVVIDIKIKNSNRLYAERIICDIRKLHNELGCFVKHTCLCDDDLDCTIWRFAYYESEESQYDIFKRLCDIWDEHLGDVVCKSSECSDHPIDFEYAHACVCPFSAK